MTALVPLPVRFGRERCGDLEHAESLEWLVTNGAGGFASGTVAGPRTRRYHGLLVAALDPPATRTVMAAEVHEILQVADHEVPLHASRWHDDTVSPRGYEHAEAFWLDGAVPAWRFCVGEVALEKRIFMVPGKNATVVQYRLARGRPARLTVKVLAAYRDCHATTHAGGWQMEVTQRSGAVQVVPLPGGRPLRISSVAMTIEPAHSWYEGFLLRREQERGLDSVDDSLHVATATVDLAVGDEVSLLLSAEPGDIDAIAAFGEVVRREHAILERYRSQHGSSADELGARLALAADQFLVSRGIAGHQGSSVIAGYHWFGDWGRDTMVSLPGLTLSTGRPELARDILVTYARFVDAGMIPNRFPDAAGVPEYNTVDATLWYLEAVRGYVEATGDLGLARELWPVLEEIVSAHERGTRYGIAIDPGDGLLRSGESGVQLTWMDAKVGDWVVTPRVGKCVEINALWLNGLAALAVLAKQLGRDDAPWRQRASRVSSSMQRFWCAETDYLFDVLDGPAGADRTLRPNQIFAVSLAACAFNSTQQRAVVDACGAALLTSHGLRSLAPAHADYRAVYEGDQRSRDGAYHQGTVWAWLLGPFALAHFRVYGDASAARSFLEPLRDHLGAHGVGTIAEIFDGAAPHRPRGCIAQAWSVAEFLRAWVMIVPKEVSA